MRSPTMKGRWRSIQIMREQLGLAMTLVRAGRLQEAIPQMQRAAALDPNDAQAHFEMGNLLRA